MSHTVLRAGRKVMTEMRPKFHLTRLLALWLVSILVLSGCGSIGELIAPYESELEELGNALFDQLMEGEGAEQAPDAGESAQNTTAPQKHTETINRNGVYTARDEVAMYIKTYGCLPENFITKDEAEDLGWVSSKGNLHEVAPGKSIGGDRFGNREGLLPKASGRQYYECDINYSGGYRGSERIVYSNDGLIFYTADHYESFTQLYP